MTTKKKNLSDFREGDVVTLEEIGRLKTAQFAEIDENYKIFTTAGHYYIKDCADRRRDIRRIKKKTRVQIIDIAELPRVVEGARD